MPQMIQEMPLTERPRERLMHQGAAALKTSELLAILLRTGTAGESVLQVAEKLLARFGSLEALSRASVQELAQTKGVGPAKAVELKAAFTLGARMARELAGAQTIGSAQDVYALLGEEMRLLEYESLRVVCLNTKSRVLAVEEISRGVLDATLFHAREVFRPAIARQAYGIIVVHNHPSGNPAPSAGDCEITKALREAGRLLEIEVFDHVILGAPQPNGGLPYYSFKETGYL